MNVVRQNMRQAHLASYATLVVIVIADENTLISNLPDITAFVVLL